MEPWSACVLVLADGIYIRYADSNPRSNLPCLNRNCRCRICSSVPPENTANVPWEAL